LNQQLKDAITMQLYQKICIGLFEAHKIVYAFLICSSIKRKEGNIPDEYWNILLRGAGVFNKNMQPAKPLKVAHFITDNSWDMLFCLQRVSTTGSVQKKDYSSKAVSHSGKGNEQAFLSRQTTS